MKAFSKITVLFLILISLNAYKKDESVATTIPASINCKISKLDYGDGFIECFTYNSLGQVSEYYCDIKDANGKTLRSVPTAYSYDLTGMVTLAKYGDGSGKTYLHQRCLECNRNV